jgi:hypothetical protein
LVGRVREGRAHFLVKVEEGVGREGEDDDHLDAGEAEGGVGESDVDVDEIADVIKILGLGIVIVPVPGSDRKRISDRRETFDAT